MSNSHSKAKSAASASHNFDLFSATKPFVNKRRRDQPLGWKFRALSFAMAVAALSSTAQATTYYWDNNGTTAGYGTAGGTWTVPTVSEWSTDGTAGTTAPGASVTTATTDTLNFGTATLGLATGTITVSGTVSAGSLTYGAASGAITLSGGTINLVGGITNNSTSLETFSSNIAVGASATWALGGGATFNNAISGAFATRIDSTGVVTLAASNSGDTGVTSSIGMVNYTESFRLNTGTTVIGTSTSLGTGAVDFRATLAASTALTGANKLLNTFVLATNAAETIGGSNNIELGGALDISNAGSLPTLFFTNTGTSTVSGTVSLSDSATVAKGLTIDVSGAAGTTTISGVIQNFTTAGSGVASGLTKTDIGTLILSNNNTYTGATTINGGTLVLDYTGLVTPTNVISGSSPLTLGGSTLNLKAQSGSTTAQTFASLALSANTSSAITVTQNGATAVNLGLGGITRNSQSALDITLPTAGTVTTTTAAGSGGLLEDANGVSYATANGGTTWLADSGTALSALSTYSTGNANYVTGNNIDVTNGDSVSGVTVNTLRFNSTNIGLTLAGTNIVNSGGILVTPGSTGGIITGGTLTSSTTAAEMVIHDYGSLNIGAAIVNANAGATATKLTLTGTGTTTLSGANTYTGTTSVNTGKLSVTGSITASTTIAVGAPSTAGAALYQSGSSSVVTNTSTGAGGFQIGSAPGAVGYYNLAAGTVNVGGEFDPGGSGGGAGTFGQLDMSGGTINLGSASATATPYLLPVRGAAGEASVINISGGTVQIASGNTVANNALDGLAVGLGNVGSLTSAITISGTGQLLTPSLTTKPNDTNFGGTAGNATNASVLNMNGGLLQTLGFGTVVNSSTLGSNNAVINLNGGTIKAGSAGNTGFLAGLGAVNVYSGGGTIDNNGQAITVGQAMLAASGTGVSSVAVGTTGAGYIAPPRVLFSGGTLTSGLLANAATGYATIDPTTGAVTGIVVTNPGSYTSTAGLTVSLVGPTGGSLAATGALTLNTGNTSGGITYLGSGTTTLSGASTYTGGTSISVGTIKNGVANALPAGSALTVSGGTYNLNGFSDTVGSLADGGTSAGIVTNSSATAATLTMNTSLPTTFSGLLSGNLALVQGGSSTETISGANNTYTGGTGIGTFQSASVVRATASGALGTGAISFDSAGNTSTARLELTGSITLANAINFTGRNNVSAGIENISGNNTLSGAIALGTGGGSYYVQSDAGLLTLSGNITPPGSGTRALTLQGAGNGLASGVIGFTTGNVLTVTAAGTGTWTLAGANTYTGATTVSSGTLLVNGSTATGSAVAVNGGTLGGTGTVAGTVAVNTGGTIAPGPGGTVGNLTTGALTLAAGSTLNTFIASDTSFSQLLAASTSAAGGFSVTLPAGATFAATGEALTIVPSGFTGAFTNSVFSTGGYTFTADYTTLSGGFDLDVTGGAVPEPTTVLGGLLLVAAAGYRQRRRLSNGWQTVRSSF